MRSNNAESLISFIQHTDGFDLSSGYVLFRGQSVKGNLLPSIARKNPKENTTRKEKEVLAQLRLQGASFINHDEDSLDLLVRAQHFGLKTRLLDWTSNPLVALWFACASKEKGDVYVYTLETEAIAKRATSKTDPFLQSETLVYQPKMNNARIIAQHGWFTLHKYSQKTSRFVALEKNQKMQSNLSEIIISHGDRDEILRSLNRHGINYKTLFPDLEGVCTHLSWQNEL